MAYGLDFLSSLGSGAVDFAKANPVLTGAGLGAAAGGLLKGGKGALVGAGLGGAAGLGATQGLFGESLAGSIGARQGQDALAAGGLGGGIANLPQLPVGGGLATTPVAQPFTLGGLTMKDIGTGLAGAGNIYSAVTGAEQSKDLIDLQKQQVNAGLLRQAEADQRLKDTQAAASAGFGNYYYA